MGPAHIRIATGQQEEKKRSRTMHHKRKVWLWVLIARETCKIAVCTAYIQRLKAGTGKVRSCNQCLPIFNPWSGDSKEQYFLLCWLCQQSPNPHRQQHTYSWCVCSEIASQFIQLLECLAWMLWVVGATSCICICLFFKAPHFTVVPKQIFLSGLKKPNVGFSIQ